MTPLEVTPPSEEVTPSESEKVEEGEETETEIMERVISECDKGIYC